MRCTLRLACFAAAFATLFACTFSRVSAGSAPLRVGVVQTFFHDIPEPLARTAMEPFISVMRETTGITGELVPGGDPMAVARQLCEGKLQLAVFHAFEYAHATRKHSELEPLMIAVHSRQSIRAHIVVQKAAGASSFADLKGKDLAVAKRTKEQCRLFVDSECRGTGASGPGDFFGQVVRPANVETALDALCEGKIHAAVVDSNGLEFYKDLKPGVFARFKVLAQSAEFGPLVVACKKGALDAMTLARIQDGLGAAKKTEAGREMLKLWMLASFEPIPADFDQILIRSSNAYERK